MGREGPVSKGKQPRASAKIPNFSFSVKGCFVLGYR